MKKIIFYSTVIFSLLLMYSCSQKKNTANDDDENKMQDTAKPRENPYKDAVIEVKVFNNDTVAGSNLHGFGYNIYISTTMYVHQPNIPAVAGNNGFATAEKAQRAGEFIVYKIRNNIMPPSVTPQELDSLHVVN
jgi:hypothetical protein